MSGETDGKVFRVFSKRAEQEKSEGEEKQAGNQSNTFGAPSHHPLKDSNSNASPQGKISTQQAENSHNQNRSVAAATPPTTPTTTSLDLENLIRKSEICSSPRHSSCEHSQKPALPPGSPRHYHQLQQPPQAVKEYSRSHGSNVGGYPVPAVSAPELKKSSGKVPISCSPSGGGGSSSLKRIAPAPGGGTGGGGTARGGERPLQCLETLAQKAGITFEDKYEVGYNFKMEKTQSPAQQPQQQGVQQQHQQQQQQQPLQISPEQFQQLQQLHFQHQFGGNVVQVKQEFPQQQSGGGQQGNTIQISADLKQQLEANANAQQQQMQQMQVDLHNQQNMGQAQQQATIGMQSLQAMQGGQVPAEWQHGRVQLLPQTISGSYIPHVYGQPLVMPNNLIPGLGQQQIQLVSNCKFQGGQLTPQMLTTAQGKQVLSGAAGNFSTYTLPTIPSSQSQTLVFSPVGVGVLGSQQQQQNILPQLAAQQQANQQQQQQGNPQSQQSQNNSSNPGTPVKPEQDMQKNLSGQKIMQKIGGSGSGPNTPTNNNAQQCVQVPQTMQTAQIISPIQQANTQFAPWLSNVTQQLWQQPFVQNGIIFRGAQQDGSQNMFIQHNPQGGGQAQVLQANSTITLPCNMVAQAQQQQQQQQQAQQQSVAVSQANQVAAHNAQAIAMANNAAAAGNKIRIAGAGEIAPKQPGRGPAILPQQAGTGNVRPALSVSTQTAQNQSLLKQSKLRAKPSPVRAINPQGLKSQDVVVSSSPTAAKPQQIGSTGLPTLGPQMHQVVTSMGNKMVVMSANNGNISILNQPGKEQQQQMQHLQIQQFQAPKQPQQFAPHGLRPPFPQQLQFQAPNAANLIQTQQQQQQAVQNQLMHQQALAQHHHQQQAHSQQQAAGQVGQQLIINGQAGTIGSPVQSSQVLTLSSASATPNGAANIQPKSAMIITAAPQVSQPSGGHGTGSDRPMMTISNAVQIVNSAGQALSSPQGPLHPPPNPLIAMTSLAVHPLQTTMTKEMSVTPVSSSKETTTVATSTASVTASTAQAASTTTTTTTTAVATATAVTSTESAAKTTTEAKAGGQVKATESISTAKSDVAATPTKEDASSASAPVTGVTNGNISGNASMKMLEKGLPKAMVKPQVLTHVIEGFVIQESNEPFPVTRQRYPVTTDNGTEDDEPPKKKLAQNALESAASGQNVGASLAAAALGPDQLACEVCGKVELKTKMKKKRFCSTACSKSAKAQAQDGNAKMNGVEEDNKNVSAVNEDLKMDTSCDSATGSTATTAPVADEESCDIVKWTVQEVCDFIRNLPGCTDYVEDFETQEIDGQALLLLKENHLVNAMGMKLGPALKIVARVESLRAGSAGSTSAANDSTGSVTNC